MTTFRLDTTARTCAVDGKDIASAVRRVSLDVAGCEPAAVTIHLLAGAVIEGDGIVHTIAEPSDADVLDRVAEVLAGVDVVELEALASSQFASMNDSPYALTLKALIQMVETARGD